MYSTAILLSITKDQGGLVHALLRQTQGFACTDPQFPQPLQDKEAEAQNKTLIALKSSSQNLNPGLLPPQPTCLNSGWQTFLAPDSGLAWSKTLKTNMWFTGSGVCQTYKNNYSVICGLQQRPSKLTMETGRLPKFRKAPLWLGYWKMSRHFWGEGKEGHYRMCQVHRGEWAQGIWWGEHGTPEHTNWPPLL